MTIVEDRPVITGGVDTHADLHVAAALDPLGGLLGVQEFPATATGYAQLLGWLGGFGAVALVGVEGTGSYGAGLARHLAAAAVTATGAELHKHYVPGAWLPHCSLAPRAPLAQLPVLAAAVYDVLPLHARLDRAALINSATGELWPPETLP